MPRISWRKLSRMAEKSRNSWKFSPSKVSRYTVFWGSKVSPAVQSSSPIQWSSPLNRHCLHWMLWAQLSDSKILKYIGVALGHWRQKHWTYMIKLLTVFFWGWEPVETNTFSVSISDPAGSIDELRTIMSHVHEVSPKHLFINPLQVAPSPSPNQSARFINNCCYTGNGADINYCWNCLFSLLAINGGVVSNIKIVCVPYVLWIIL